MDALYGANKWTDDKKVGGAKKWYRRRKAIIDIVVEQADHNPHDPTAAIEAISRRMRDGDLSLDELGKQASSHMAKIKQHMKQQKQL